MTASNPSKYSWEGTHSWVEPMIGARQEWRLDRWRWPKIGAVLIPVFLIGHLASGQTIGFSLRWAPIVALIVCAYFWLCSFLPRQIRLFEDRVSFFRIGQGQLQSYADIRYADVRKLSVSNTAKFHFIALTLTSGKETIIASANGGDIMMLRKHLIASGAIDSSGEQQPP